MADIIDLENVKRIQAAKDAKKLIQSYEDARSKKTELLRRKDAIDIFADKMAGGAIGNHFIPYPLQFQPFTILGDVAGQKTIYEIHEGDVLALKSLDYLRTTIFYAMRSIENIQAQDAFKITKDFAFSCEERAKVAKALLDNYPYIKESSVPSFRFKSEPGFCFSRMPFDPAPGPAPCWEKIRDSVSMPSMFDTLRWFIGEIFRNENLEETMKEKILWIYGKGGTGKGSLLTMLYKAFGPAYGIVPGQQARDKYWTSSLFGKRIAVGDDMNDTYILENEEIKRISGKMLTERRGMHSAPVPHLFLLQFIFTSNFKPHFTNEDHQSRRLLYVEFKERTGPVDPEFKNNLVKESAAIIHDCIEYRRGHDEPPSQDFADLVEESTSHITEVLDSMIGSRPALLFGEKHRMDPADLWSMFGPGEVRKKFKSEVLKVLADRYRVEMRAVNCQRRGRKVKMLIGVGRNL